MGKKSYPKTTMNTAMFGKTVTSGSGSKFKPTDFQRQLVGLTESNAVNALNNYLNPDYESEDFLRGEEYYNNKLNNQLQNNYLNPALSRNLLRGSTASDILRGFEKDLSDTLYERQNDWRNQQLQNYQAAMLPYATVYDMMKGTTGLSQALANSVANYNAQQDANNTAMWTGLANALGSGASAFKGGKK